TAGSRSTRTFPMARSRRRGKAPRSEWCSRQAPNPSAERRWKRWPAARRSSPQGGAAEICARWAVTVEPSDADGIAAALGQLLDAPERRAEFARAGRKRVEA